MIALMVGVLARRRDIKAVVFLGVDDRKGLGSIGVGGFDFGLSCCYVS